MRLLPGIAYCISTSPLDLATGYAAAVPRAGCVLEEPLSHPLPLAFYSVPSDFPTPDGGLRTPRYSGPNCRVIIDSSGSVSVSETSIYQATYFLPGLGDTRVSSSCCRSSGKSNNQHRLTQGPSWPAGGDDHLCLEDSGKSSQRTDTLADF